MMKRMGLILALTAALSGHAQAAGWNGDAVLGGAVGGAAGAAIGSAVGGRDAAIIGGMVGGAAGVAVATRYTRPQVVRPGTEVVYVYDGYRRVGNGFHGGPHRYGHRHGRGHPGYY